LHHLAATFHCQASSLPFTNLGLPLSLNKSTVVGTPAYKLQVKPKDRAALGPPRVPGASAPASRLRAALGPPRVPGAPTPASRLKAQAPEVSGDQVIAQAIKALRAGPLHNHLVRERPKTVQELYDNFQKFSNSEVLDFRKLE
jgi:hypothetical protein